MPGRLNLMRPNPVPGRSQATAGILGPDTGTWFDTCPGRPAFSYSVEAPSQVRTDDRQRAIFSVQPDFAPEKNSVGRAFFPSPRPMPPPARATHVAMFGRVQERGCLKPARCDRNLRSQRENRGGRYGIEQLVDPALFDRPDSAAKVRFAGWKPRSWCFCLNVLPQSGQHDIQTPGLTARPLGGVADRRVETLEPLPVNAELGKDPAPWPRP
jgi:hypothetical protein